MAVNKYQKFLYSIELNGKENRDRQSGVKPATNGWTREAPRATSPYTTVNGNVPAKISRADTKEDRATPAGAYFERDLHVIHGNLINTPAKFTARRRGAGN